MGDDHCDVQECTETAKLYATSKRRCLAHVAWDAPELRSDKPRPLPIGEPERRLWRLRVAGALILQVEAERVANNERLLASAACAAVEILTERHVEADRILETFGDIGGGAALRVLRGRP